MMRFRQSAFRALVAPLLVAGACSSEPPPPGGAPAAPATSHQPAPAPPAAPAPDAPPPPPEREVTPAPSPYEVLPANVREVLDRPFTGDFDEMVKRRLIRAGVVFNRTQYFIDRGSQRGMVYDSLLLFEEQLNKRLKTGNLKVHVAFVPLQRDQLFKALNDGKVDLVAAALTITPEREKLASFSNPTRSSVSEVVVGSRTSAPVKTAEDLSGREVFVRKSSSYYESLVALNQKLSAEGRPPVVIKESPEALEDDDILEMANAGLVELTVVDDFIARFWSKVFPDMKVYDTAAVRTGGSIGVAVRSANPRLRQAINIWIKEYGPRTAFGNVVERSYLQQTDYVRRAADDKERKKFLAIVELFRRYSEQYNLDFLLMAAQGYQESRLDQNAKSRVGAIGIMQVMPQTGKQLKVGDIKKIEPNIHAGVKYIRWMEDQYFKDDPMDDLNKALMSFAAYNAGPGRLRQLRQEAKARGLNPNVWFGNVERIASERIGRETVQYVSNIYKYYVAYRLVRERAQARERTKAQGGASP
jgi:membrane-bound lytic murein transglycosylase MltF